MINYEKVLGNISEEELFKLLKKERGDLRGYSYTVVTPFCMQRKHYYCIQNEDGSYPILHFGAGKFKRYFILSHLDLGGLDISECEFHVTPSILTTVNLHGGKFYDGGALKSLHAQGKLEEWERPIPDADFPKTDTEK